MSEVGATMSVRSDATLVDLLDRLLTTGVVLSGDVELCIADVTLAQVRLLAALGSVDSLQPAPRDAAAVLPPPVVAGRPQPGPGTGAPPGTRVASAGSVAVGEAGGVGRASGAAETTPLDTAQRALDNFADGLAREPEKVQQGLVQLVLSLVELLRQLMERQALRRFEAGSLTEEQVERVGTTLMLLQRRMDELRDIFGLTEDDLAIDLGPLGRTI